ncbi:hypothetical protein FIBSPDRAFT_964727 [Athelia psychrophila]|uniref:Uncharacterized protein n=1 Tax=Athelia psychrophila TaxID=1759441 RepID=A0A165XEQ7_9AGAM|nr:hypothetical protein FIBSPDRAFT_964727 [Fibularhizoctonia sp. CBS 109695]
MPLRLVDQLDARARRSIAFYPSCIEEEVLDDQGAKVDHTCRRSPFMSGIGEAVSTWNRRIQERAGRRRFALPFDAAAFIENRQFLVTAPTRSYHRLHPPDMMYSSTCDHEVKIIAIPRMLC